MYSSFLFTVIRTWWINWRALLNVKRDLPGALLPQRFQLLLEQGAICACGHPPCRIQLWTGHLGSGPTFDAPAR